MADATVTAMLRKFELFSGLGDQEIDFLAQQAEVTAVRAGEHVVLEKQLTNKFFLIVSGRVEIIIQVSETASSKGVAILGAGECLGELGLVGIKRRSASARAVEPVKALSWDIDRVSEYFEQNPAAGFRFMRTLAGILARRMIMTNQELRNAWSIYDRALPSSE